jgi:hypothetical protein
MRKLPVVLVILATFAVMGRAADLQGVIADWKCTEAMVRNGREKTLKQNRSCSLMKNPDRRAYGLITDDKKFYRFNDAGTKRVRELLQNSPDKDNLRVIVQGDLTGNTINASNVSIL